MGKTKLASPAGHAGEGRPLRKSLSGLVESCSKLARAVGGSVGAGAAGLFSSDEAVSRVDGAAPEPAARDARDLGRPARGEARALAAARVPQSPPAARAGLTLVLTLSSLSALPTQAVAHGGVEASAFVLDPDRVGVVADEQFRFRWLDASSVGAATASTTHTFYYSTFLPPPWSLFLGPEDLEGTPIVEGVPEASPENAHTWDTRAVPAGAYWIWSIASDPDLELPFQSIVFSPFPLVVARSGEPLHPYVVLETPDSPSAFAESDRFTVRYAAFDPDGTGRVRLARALDGTSTFVSVAEDLPPDEAGRLEVDTQDWPAGDWVLRAEIEDARGLRFSTFARFTLLVFRREGRDAGARPDGGVAPGPSGDAGGLPSERPAESESEEAGAGEGCECLLGRRPGAASLGLLAGSLGLLTLGRRRRPSPMALRQPRPSALLGPTRESAP